MKHIIILLSITLFCSPLYARDTSQAINELDRQISSTTSPKAIADLHVFKARQQLEAGNTDLAISSYIDSLRVKQKGATWIELGQLYFKTGKYTKGFIVAAKVTRQYPHLEEGVALLEKSKLEQKRIYNQLYPESIIINSPVKGKRTRFDYEDPNAQNVAFLAAARKSDKDQKKKVDRAYQQKVRKLDDRYNKELSNAKKDGHGTNNKYQKNKYREEHAKSVREHRKELQKLRHDPVAYVQPPPKEKKKNRNRNSGNVTQPSYSDGEHDAWAGLPQKSQSGAYAAGYEDEDDRGKNRGTVINGNIDSQGRSYAPAGGGNAWRNDGTFMQKAGGGYIDTKTGQFVPAN